MILSWLNPSNGLHTYGINYYGKNLNNIKTVNDDKFILKDRIKQFTIQICKIFECKYFVQGEADDWLFIEFFGATEDRILMVIEYINNSWLKNELYQNEILWTEPTKELLNLFK